MRLAQVAEEQQQEQQERLLPAFEMKNEEPAHLVHALKHCTHCGLDGMHTFQFFNNKRKSQPRYECSGCHQQFTQGGGSYRKTIRKKFNSRPSSSGSPTPPPSPLPGGAPSAADHDHGSSAPGHSPSSVPQDGVPAAATEVGDTTSPSGVTVPVRPRKHLVQVTTKFAGKRTVRCVLMDLIPRTAEV